MKRIWPTYDNSYKVVCEKNVKSLSKKGEKCIDLVRYKENILI